MPPPQKPPNASKSNDHRSAFPRPACSTETASLFLIETFLHSRCGRSIRPFANSNYELGDRLWTVPKLRIQRNRRVAQIGTPGGFVCQWKIEHQMRYVVPKGIIKVACPRHHVTHRARLRPW